MREKRLSDECKELKAQAKEKKKIFEEKISLLEKSSYPGIKDILDCVQIESRVLETVLMAPTELSLKDYSNSIDRGIRALDELGLMLMKLDAKEQPSSNDKVEWLKLYIYFDHAYKNIKDEKNASTTKKIIKDIRDSFRELAKGDIRTTTDSGNNKDKGLHQLAFEAEKELNQ